MNFIWCQIKYIYYGGLPMLRKKMRLFPSWFMWCFATGRCSRRIAYSLSRIAVAIRPKWSEAYTLLAETLISSGHFDEAFDAWERAFRLKPVWSNNFDRIYRVFWAYGQTWATRSITQRYIEVQDKFACEHQLDKLGIRFLSRSTDAIGHIALIDSHVKASILGKRSTPTPIILVPSRPSNPCYLEYWRRYIPNMITDSSTIKLLLPLEKYLVENYRDSQYGVRDSTHGKQFDGFYSVKVVEAKWDAEGRGPLLTLSDSDHERGWKCLQSLGVPSGAWFVGLHVRDAGIGASRDSDINSYRLAMEAITARGGWVIRMGDPIMKPCPPVPHVIDYAHSNLRSDWMDVFIWARSRFFIGTQSGPQAVPPSFGVPCVLTNWTSPGVRLWFSKDICILKLHWSDKEKRYLNFAEVVSTAIGRTESSEYLSSMGIRMVDNTPEEIKDAVEEMMDRIEGKIQYSREDDEFQRRFDGLYDINDSKTNARIGRAFLRKWAHLL